MENIKFRLMEGFVLNKMKPSGFGLGEKNIDFKLCSMWGNYVEELSLIISPLLNRSHTPVFHFPGIYNNYQVVG